MMTESEKDIMLCKYRTAILKIYKQATWNQTDDIIDTCIKVLDEPEGNK